VKLVPAETAVFRVTHQYEYSKTRTMEMFGWRRDQRVEIRQKGDALGRLPLAVHDFRIVTLRVAGCVELHFSRSHDVPNLEELKAIEAEYNSVPSPTEPRLGPAITAGVVAAVATAGSIAAFATGGASSRTLLGLGIAVSASALAAAAVWFTRVHRERRRVADTIRLNLRRRMALIQRVDSLRLLTTSQPLVPSRRFD